MSIHKALIVALYGLCMLPNTTSSYTPSQSYYEALMEPSRVSIKALSSVFHYEARGEKKHCQEAVAHVALNRAKQASIPVEDVVAAKGQFSFVKHLKIPSAPDYWDVVSKMLLLQEMQGLRKDTTHGAMFFFRRDSNNSLTKKLKLVYSCGNHNFFKGG